MRISNFFAEMTEGKPAAVTGNIQAAGNKWMGEIYCKSSVKRIYEENATGARGDCGAVKDI
ncbi:hypothetical protein AALB16_15180 [Lachnospiraceae bacterium 62-35]